MNLNQALSALNELEATLNAYQHALGCLNYDGETAAPRNSAPARGETMAFLSGIVHEKVTAPGTGEMLETLLANKDSLSLKDRRRAEVLKEERDDLTLVPADEYMAYQQLMAESMQVWHDAKLASDYPAFAPYLEKIVAYNRRFAARKHAIDSQPGFEGFQLLRPVAGEDRYFVVTRWADQDSYDAWWSKEGRSSHAGSRKPVASAAQLLEFEVALDSLKQD